MSKTPSTPPAANSTPTEPADRLDEGAVNGVAEALWLHCRTKLERSRGTTWPDLTDEQRAAWFPQARAALAALSEDTPQREADE